MSKITEREIRFAMSILDVPGDDDAEEQALRQLQRDGMPKKRANAVLRMAIKRLSGGPQ